MKRENFCNGVKDWFLFLQTDFGYRSEGPRASTQPNGSVIRDTFTFANSERDRVIKISNAYHPVDYGFEINCYRPSVSLNPGDGFLAALKVKEEQDLAQVYLEGLAREFRETYDRLIRGVSWPAD